MTIETSRRGFLKGSAALVASVLVVGFDTKGALAQGKFAALNPFVKINTDGTVTIVIKHCEMGQGTTTGLSTIVAEELDADWTAVTTEFAPADSQTYGNTITGFQGTGGSASIFNSYTQHRQAGAAARAMLVAAAAEAWGVDAEDITVSDGVISSGSNSAGFGEFVAAAAEMAAPAEPALKDPASFKLIGNKTLLRLDNDDKITGKAIFSLDVKLPGMVYTTIARSGHPGAVVSGFDASGAQEVEGFLDARVLPNNAGVAVYASSTWAAIQARDAISVDWDTSNAETRSTAEMFADHLAVFDSDPSYQTRPGGDLTAAKAAVEGADKVVEAIFRFPHLAHAPLEPVNCVVEPLEGGVRFHDGCQGPGLVQLVFNQAFGMDIPSIEVDSTYIGGSFGRRANVFCDYQIEAYLAMLAYGGQTPVKLIWTREDDIRGEFYRPMAAHKARIGLTADGTIAGWDHRLAVQPINKGTAAEAMLVRDGIDPTSGEGIQNVAYSVPNMSVGLTDAASKMKVLWWRSVGHTHNGYACEVAMDMAAEAAGRDPLEFRLSMLEGSEEQAAQRMAGVLRLVAEKSGWGTPVPKGTFRGIAVQESFRSFVAQVAEVSIVDDAVKIEKVISAVDCGVAVNPDVIEAQIEGAIGFGLGAAMRNEITFTEGRVDQSNFHDFQPLRMGDIRDIETHILPSDEAPTGVGEIGLPPALPAVANAIYAATGTRLLEMPWTKHVTFA